MILYEEKNGSFDCNVVSDKEIGNLKFMADTISKMKDVINEQETARYILVTNDVSAARRTVAVDVSLRANLADAQNELPMNSALRSDSREQYSILQIDCEEKEKEGNLAAALESDMASSLKKIAHDDDSSGVLVNVVAYKSFDDIKNFCNICITKNKDMYICGSISERDMRRLIFEMGFEKILVKNAPMTYFVSLFEERLTQEKMVLEGGLSAKEVVVALKKYRGSLFSESDIDRLIQRVVSQMDLNNPSLNDRVFERKYMEFMTDDVTPEINRNDIVGNLKIFDEIDRKAAYIKFEMDRDMNTTRKPMNMAFAGSPGTGKSMTARYVSEQFAAKGITNGELLIVDKSQLVGKYVGHTADKINKLFAKAKGGIILIDEAGCLTNEDVFTREAITEIVRFMETNPDTVVIFASYPETIERLKNMDAGLGSRIGTTLTFEDYTMDELYEIFELMLSKDGYTPEDCREMFESYMLERKERLGQNFGNAREVRNLVQKLEEVIAVNSILAGIDAKSVNSFDQAELSETIDIIKKNEKTNEVKKMAIGF